MVKRKKKYPFWFEDPFENMRRIQEQFHNMMREMWRGPWFRLPEIKFPKRFLGTRFIPIRVGETDKELILRAELPGFSKDEIKLKVTPTAVYISAEKKKKSIEKEETYFRMERAYSSASRVMTLPEEVKTDGVKAKFENGVLEIILKKRVPKKKEEKEVKIE